MLAKTKLVEIQSITEEESYCGLKFGRILNQKMLAIFQYCCAFLAQPATRLLPLATDFHELSGSGSRPCELYRVMYILTGIVALSRRIALVLRCSYGLQSEPAEKSIEKAL